MSGSKKEILKNNGFMPWRWGNEDKLEGYLDADVCKKLIGVNEPCYVAVLLNENEARFIKKIKFEDKVSGHEKQIQIEKIIYGKDKSRLYKNGRLVLIEDIIPLNDIIEILK
ncbi:MAG: hypothetical protein ACOCRZ_04405 [Halothermotrichaceae bacterium]